MMKVMLVFIFALCSVSVFGQSKQISGYDKSQIIAAILRKQNFQESELSGGSEKPIQLLADNISIRRIPPIRGKKFALVTQSEVDEMMKTGVEYYSFGDFEIERSLVRVYFSRDYVNSSDRESNGSTVEYICRKIAGKWKVKGRMASVYAS